MILKYYKNHYYITKRTVKTSVKNKVFSYRFHYLNEDDIKGLMSIYNYKYNYVKSLKSIFIDCTVREFNELVNLFNEYDFIPNQKKLKITILDTNLTKLKEYGFENNLNIASSENSSLFFNFLAFPFSSTNILPELKRSNFTSYIKFMNSKNITDIVSSPTVSIFDGKKTVFEVVKNIPFKTGQTVSNDNITKTTTSIDYKDVGLKLEVLPIINKNQAFLDLSLTIENILDKSDTPVTSKRHFKQYVSLNVGETFVLNGINQTESYTDDFKTPFLSDIPYIGWLFKNEYEDIKTSNLTVLLELDY
jgi:general secretion pathway protein D